MTSRVGRWGRALAAIVVVGAVWLPVAAGAGEGGQDPDTYAPGSSVPTTVAPETTAPPVEVSGEVTDPGSPGQAPASTQAAESSSLPLTGGDVAGLLAIGGVALVTGAVLVRGARRRREHVA